jgi:hypothetical protein
MEGGHSFMFVLVDITMRAVNASEPSSNESSSPEQSVTADDNFRDEESGLNNPVPLSVRSSNGQSSTVAEDETEVQPRFLSTPSATGGFLRKKASQLLDAVSLSSHKGQSSMMTPRLATLVNSYANSNIAAAIKQEIEEVKNSSGQNGNGTGNEGELRDVAVESSLLRGRKRASWSMQFRILSGRAFKNLYRDPALLAAHYLSSIALARK